MFLNECITQKKPDLLYFIDNPKKQLRLKYRVKYSVLFDLIHYCPNYIAFCFIVLVVSVTFVGDSIGNVGDSKDLIEWFLISCLILEMSFWSCWIDSKRHQFTNVKSGIWPYEDYFFVTE